ncbi:hypothetical protein [Parasphingopyxis sp.]|uniref:hypothetical protein n=1 Tax=Parasphingopyxis sp. TaxID=1920299 RepID=UPI002611D59E|nr:hypothetical protein [Parasphingopyxis sp.]
MIEHPRKPDRLGPGTEPEPSSSHSPPGEFADPGSPANDSTGSDEPGGSPEPGRIRPHGARFLKTYLKARRERDWQFPKGLFSDPAWDILLELYVAESEDRPIFESLIGPAVSLPEKSGLRWLSILETRQLVMRDMDTADGQDARISLTANAIAGMNQWLDGIAPEPAGDPDTGSC